MEDCRDKSVYMKQYCGVNMYCGEVVLQLSIIHLEFNMQWLIFKTKEWNKENKHAWYNSKSEENFCIVFLNVWISQLLDLNNQTDKIQFFVMESNSLMKAL